MIWVAYTLIAILFVAAADINQKISLTSKSNISSITNNFYCWGLIGLFALVLTLVLKLPFPVFTFSFLAKLLLLSIVYFFGGTLFYASFKSNSVSISSILGTISSVITTFLGIIFFSESTSPLKFFGSIIILTSIIFINFSKGARLDKYNILALLGGVCYGVAYTIDKSFVLNLNPIVYQSIISLSVAIFSLIVRPKLIISESKSISRLTARSIVMAASFFFFYQFFLFSAYKNGGEVGRIDVFNNSSIFVIFLLEFLILKDKSNLKKKIIASSLAVFGATLLTIAK
jgi:drug/metabolite transporter (DMT)-like permease